MLTGTTGSKYFTALNIIWTPKHTGWSTTCFHNNIGPRLSTILQDHHNKIDLWWLTKLSNSLRHWIIISITCKTPYFPFFLNLDLAPCTLTPKMIWTPYAHCKTTCTSFAKQKFKFLNSLIDPLPCMPLFHLFGTPFWVGLPFDGRERIKLEAELTS